MPQIIEQQTSVTLRASVWIETDICHERDNRLSRHTPRECVDWNLGLEERKNCPKLSHSARVCGLKLLLRDLSASAARVTLRASVWIETPTCVGVGLVNIVTLRASVWIETGRLQYLANYNRSHSARVCGLKQLALCNVIEPDIKSHSARVCGLKLEFWRSYNWIYKSHSARVCGLKLQ